VPEADVIRRSGLALALLATGVTAVAFTCASAASPTNRAGTQVASAEGSVTHVAAPAEGSVTHLMAQAGTIAAHVAAPAAHSAPHVAEPAGYWTGNVNAPTPATLHGAKVVDAQQVNRLLKTGNAVVIDVSNAPRRPQSLAPGAPWMPTAHPGIPGALWIPGAGLGVVPVDVEAYFRAKLAAATGGDLSRPIVIYCHRGCWLSWNAAKRAVSYGYRNVAWFPQGIEGWRARGLSTTELRPLQPPAASPSKTPPPAPSAPPTHYPDDDADSQVVLPA
jgi:PQQ-dependent catabolism-associated CXXCW motif protein